MFVFSVASTIKELSTADVNSFVVSMVSHYVMVAMSQQAGELSDLKDFFLDNIFQDCVQPFSHEMIS